MEAEIGEINPKLVELKGVKELKQVVHDYEGLCAL